MNNIDFRILIINFNWTFFSFQFKFSSMMSLKIFNSIAFKFCGEIKCWWECTDIFIPCKFCLNLRSFFNNFLYNYFLFIIVGIRTWMISFFLLIFFAFFISFISWMLIWVGRIWIMALFITFVSLCSFWLRILMLFK